MNKLTCFVAMVLAAVSAMALAALAIAPRAFAQPASTGATGVCCITDPISCIIVTEADCAQQGGTYGGDNTVCEPFFVNPFGGCTCGPGQGDCHSVHNTPGCELLECCEVVCILDPFCCAREWDPHCPAHAADNPAVCPRTPCTWRWAEPRGSIDVADLLTLLAAWGNPGFCDFSGDGIINVPDLLALLAAWGPCQ